MPQLVYASVAARRPTRGKWRRLCRDGIQHQGQLSLQQRCPFVLFEYAEEFPTLMMNPGMATLVNNYYRKRNARDPHVPEVQPRTPAPHRPPS
jgi:transcription initiation factor TFIID subunit 1, fungi type